MSMNDSLRFGIIGTGTIAEFHAKAIKAVPGASLIGVCGSTLERALPFAAQNGGQAYASLAEMLADPRINAVAIATPSGLHGEAAIMAAKAGKHVLCEKPLDITPWKAREIVTACRDNRVILAPVFQSRYGAGARLIREALDGGRFGKLLFSTTRIKWFRSQAYYDSAPWRGTWELDGGGCLINQAIHAIDLMLWFGGIPNEVYGHYATRSHDIAVEDNAAAMARFASGAFGVIEASTSCEPGLPLEVSVTGEKGTATLTGDIITTWAFCDEHPLDARARAPAPSQLGSGGSDPKAISTAGHEARVSDMIKAARGEENGLIDGLEACYPIDLIHGLYQSHRTGKPVALPYGGATPDRG